MSSDFRINECDKYVYVKDTNEGYVILNSIRLSDPPKTCLNLEFDVKNFSLANVILGVKITRISNRLALSQTHYFDKILEKFNKFYSNVTRTLVDINFHLSKNGRKHILDEL